MTSDIATEKVAFEPDYAPDGRLLATSRNIANFGEDNILVYSRRTKLADYAVRAISERGKTLMNAHLRSTYKRKNDARNAAWWDNEAQYCVTTQQGLDDFREGQFFLLWETWNLFRDRFGSPLSTDVM